MTLYLNIFRREPAITKFDWPFTLIHRSSEEFLTSTRSASTSSYTSFNLPMDRSLSFGSATTNYSHFRTRFRFGFMDHPLNLASITTRRLIMQKAARTEIALYGFE